jgi:hemolysin activation/secretion protein
MTLKRAPAWLVLLILILTAPPRSNAQVDPGAVHQQSSEVEQYYKLQKQIDRKANQPSSSGNLSDQTAVPKASAAADGDKRFLLIKLAISPSSIFTPSELASLTSTLEGHQVALDDLSKLIDKINTLYKDKGYLAARAVLPPQKVVFGVVKIQLIESRLGKVIVQNNGRTRAHYFTDRLRCQPGDLIQVGAINAALAQFNAVSDQKVKAVLRAGETFGTTDLLVEVDNRPSIANSLSGDDAGLASTGRNRIGDSETIDSLFGFADPLRAGVFWSDGMWAGFGSYDFPLTRDGLRLGPAVSYNDIRVRQSALQKLGVNGKFYDLSLQLSRPLLARRSLLVTGYLAPHFQESTLQSDSFVISNIPVRSLETGLNFKASDAHGFWAANLFASGGDYSLKKLNAFVKFGGSATRVQQFGSDFVAILRTQGQGKAADPSPLPPSQQFQIGGIATVRGYPEGTLIGDSAYGVSAEVDGPVPFQDKRLFGSRLKDRLRSAIFVDHAGLLSPKATYLTGTGIGLVMNLSTYLGARVYLGTPLESRDAYSRLQVHFALEAKPPFGRVLRLFRPSE